MFLRCVESQGCHLIPLSYLLSRFSAKSCCSCCLVLFTLMDHFPDVRQNSLLFWFFCCCCSELGCFVWLLLSSLQVIVDMWYVELGGDS